MRVKKGFTLIELLVVIAIIAILAGMLLPALARARDMARSAQCQSNQKQMFNGFAFFQNNYDDKMPPAGNVGLNWLASQNKWYAPYWGWHEFIMYELNTKGFATSAKEMNYVGFDLFVPEGQHIDQVNGHPMKQWSPAGLFQFHTGSIFDCPSSMPAVEGGGARWEDYLQIHKGLPNYHPTTPGNLAKWHRKVSDPTKKILYMDAGGNENGNPDVARSSWGLDPWPGRAGYSVTNAGTWWSGFAGYFVTPRHMGGSNAAYIDGHVESIPGIQEGNGKFWNKYDHDNAPWAWYSDNYGSAL